MNPYAVTTKESQEKIYDCRSGDGKSFLVVYWNDSICPYIGACASFQYVYPNAIYHLQIKNGKPVYGWYEIT